MSERQSDDHFEFTCKRCSEIGWVHFSPRDADDLLCSDCYEETGGRTYDMSNVSKAPARKHGTRVAFRITCSQCEKEDELDYVPKGVPVDELLCMDCMREKSGNASRWAMVNEVKDREKRRKPKYPVDCADCGAEEMLPFKPFDDGEYWCYNCYLARQRREELGLPEEPPEDKGSKHDLGDNVFIRRKK